MIKINCIAVDDEPLALSLIEKHIAQIPELNLITKCKNARVAEDYFNLNEIDLVFLDVQMPGKTGIEFSRILPKSTMVIFTTAYEQYAIKGFEVNAIDYIVKPWDFERFKIACYKAIDFYKLKSNQNKEVDEFILVKSEYQTIKINFNDILYVEGLKDYVKIYVSTQSKPILSRQNLKTFEAQLNPELFYRIQKSFLVALNKITSSSKNHLSIADKMLPIGETYKESFFKKYFEKK